MIGLGLHFAALFLGTSLTISAVLCVLVRLATAPLAMLHARTRVRVFGAALAAPPLAAAATVALVALPHQWLGMGDHCDHHPGHVHLCLAHGAPLPHPLVVALVVGALAVIIARLASTAAVAWRATRAVRALRDGSRAERDLRVLAGRGPVALTAGVLDPFVVVSDAVLGDGARWRAVIAHERAHVVARDPLVRWLARLACAFHAPGAGQALLAPLHDAQELAADQAAAEAIGSRIEVAEALIAWMRWARSASGASAHSIACASRFDAGPFEQRVRALLEPPPQPARPALSASALLVLVCAGLVLGVVLATPELHHSVETFFGLVAL